MKERVETVKIVYEDGTFLVIDKPSGWVVNRAETTKGAQIVQDWVEKYLKVPQEESTRDTRGTLDICDTFCRRAGIVHRLDKETSGLLLVAKTPTAFENLQKQFKERKVEKRYLALVHGKVEPPEGVIEAAISRSPFDRKKFGVFLGGREAKTKYRVLSIKYKVWERKEFFYSLLELTPETGRTHQIRVHLKYIGHPVVGDEKYAGRKIARQDRQWCPRQFLHAAYLKFRHPKTKEEMEFKEELPKDLKEALQTLDYD